LPRIATLLIVSLICTLCAATAGSGPSVGRIVEPSGDAPAEIAAGDSFRAIARLRLPLTPPPGVQQPRVWEGWRVLLSRRVEITLDGASSLIEFPARLVRIRPREEDRYSITAETPPWLPPGRYDLAITGPGFEGLAAESIVVVGEGREAHAARAEWRMSGDATAELVRVGPRGGVVVLEVVAPDTSLGLRATSVDDATGERRRATLVAATWTSAPGPSGRGRARLLRYAVELPRVWRGEVHGFTVELERVAGSECRSRIRWGTTSERVGPTEWRELYFEGLDDPVSIAWDFGDGEHGVGRRVRHRWIFSDEAQVSATGFDRIGTACSATTSAGVELEASRGCGCASAGRHARLGGLLGFFLSVALPRE